MENMKLFHNPVTVLIEMGWHLSSICLRQTLENLNNEHVLGLRMERVLVQSYPRVITWGHDHESLCVLMQHALRGDSKHL